MKIGMNRRFQIVLLLAAACGLGACGFHLRQGVPVPASMQHIHVGGSGDLQRQLERGLAASGVTIEDHPGVGTAELLLPTAAFSTDTLSYSGAARVTEYAVRYHVEFSVNDGLGKPLIPQQHIDMSREFSYDATDTIGNAAQIEELQRGLNDDMVQAILFRLRAAEQHPKALAAAAASSAPAAASSSAPAAVEPAAGH